MRLRITEEIDRFNGMRRREDEPRMTQGRLAQLVGVRPTTISEWNHGKYDATVAHVMAVASMLRCSFQDLLGL